MKKEYYQESLDLHKRTKGKLAVHSKIPVYSMEDLSLIYTPGVAKVCEVIANAPEEVYTYTLKQNSVAVISDGSAVLGLGDIGPEAAIPVMEGKAILFKQLGGIDAWPICLNTKNVDDIVNTIRCIAPVFGGINLEDFSAPRCFEIEDRLQDLGIPVLHDDQHGTAIVLLAALLNACKVTQKQMKDLTVVINGAGAAGIAISKILCSDENFGNYQRVKDVIVCDSKGIIEKSRSDLSAIKQQLVPQTNLGHKKGTLRDAIHGADVFIGVSKGNLLKAKDISTMNANSIVLAMANPIPEIMPEEAIKGGAKVVGTGRSDYPNQINNVLAFPGLFSGALRARAKKFTNQMKIAAITSLSNSITDISVDRILPSPLDNRVAPIIAEAVRKAAIGL